MNKTTNEGSGTAVGAERQVRPCAWWHRAENGNIRCWTSAHAESLRLANEVGIELAPLYDQAALDNAVAAEREKCASWAENYDLGTPDGHAIAACIRGA